MIRNKQWVYKEISKSETLRISHETGISELMARVFLNRGIYDTEYIKKFINPSFDQCHDPFLMKDMKAAVDRIVHAVREKEKITIYGDYDVDGVTSTSILFNFLLRQNTDVDFYIPDRMDEGYGLSISGIDKIRLTGTSLIITVDCGITAFDEVKYTIENNIDIIITDHHECRDTIPEAYAVINPHRSDCSYPFKELAGVGVVYKLINALCIEMNLGDIYKDYVDLTAMGTVADVVPLVDENRIIVKYGIPKIEQTSNIGLQALKNASGLKDKPVNSYGIGFVLAPRINAAGRVGSAARAVRLFTTANEEEADDIACELNEENKYRQNTELEILQQVVKMIESEVDLSEERVIVVAGEGWHHGIIGIVASKITEKYYRPCILLSTENGICKGSGRSIEAFNLFEALCHCSEYLEKYGGHELAAGMTLKMENFKLFKDKINAYADTVLKDSELIPCVKIDAFVESEDIAIKNVRQLEMMAPFGAGNHGPVFAYNSLKINDIRTVGDNKHLKLKLEDKGTVVDAIGFSMGELIEVFSRQDILDVVFSLEINTWNSIEKVQLNLKDIKFDEVIAKKNEYLFRLEKNIEFGQLNDYNKDNTILYNIEELVPERSDLVAVYQYMKANYDNQFVIENMFIFAKKIASNYKICMNYFKAKKSIDIFEELGLLSKKEVSENKTKIVLLNKNGKTNVENSTIYMELQSLKRNNTLINKEE